MIQRRLLYGAMQLTLSNLLLRGVGMAYRVVLQGRIGTEGMGLYQLIMTVYMLFSMVSCAGLTITVSRLCAERPQAQRSIVRKSCLYAVVLGVLCGAALYAFSDFIAHEMLGDLRASSSLKWIAPSLPMMSVSAALRGWFLAVGDVVRPTAAQVTEQLARVTLVLALLFSFEVTELSSACAVILFGATAAELLSVLMHILFYLRSSGRTEEVFPMKLVLNGVGPLLLGSVMQSGMQTAENLLIPKLLRFSGMAAQQALEQYGMLCGMVLPILTFPAALPASLGTLLLPKIARENALGRAERVRRLTCRTLSSTLLLSAACCAAFLLCGDILMRLLYRSEAAGGMLRLLAPMLPLLYLDSMCDALLKGLGKQSGTMVIETADSALRIAGILLLLPKAGMAGYVAVMYASAFLCCLARMKMLLSVTDLARSTLIRMLFFAKPKTRTA